nr:metallophosphatase [bacterium]
MTGNKVRGKLSVAPAIVLMLLLFWGCGPREELQPLCIIHTNDIHGHILPERTAGSRDLTGGAAVLAAWISRVRRENEAAGIPTLLLDAGDIFMGTPEGQAEKGAAMIDLMNRMGYDAMTVGNHEFDFGYYNLKALAAAARFPFLGSNVYRNNNVGLVEFLKPSLTARAGDVTVLIVGVTTDEIPTITISGNVGNIDFRDPVSSAANQIKLFSGARPLVVVLSHLGLEGDETLAESVADIDVIIGGHSHTLLETPEIRNGVVICQAGSYGRWAGKLDLLIDPSTGEVADYEYRLFENLKGTIPPDIPVERELDRLENGLPSDCRRDYGMSLSDLVSRDREESCLGDIIADAMR